MEREFKSEYYMTTQDLMQRYNIPADAKEDVEESMGWMEDYLMVLTLTSLSN